MPLGIVDGLDTGLLPGPHPAIQGSGVVEVLNTLRMDFLFVQAYGQYALKLKAQVNP